MMGGDSSIYSGNGVGGTPGVAGGREKRHGEPKLPRKVVACSYCFSAGLLVFVECPAHKSRSLWTTPNPGVKSKRIALVADVMLINRSNQFRRCFLVQFLLFSAWLWGKPQTQLLSKRIS